MHARSIRSRTHTLRANWGPNSIDGGSQLNPARYDPNPFGGARLASRLRSLGTRMFGDTAGYVDGGGRIFAPLPPPNSGWWNPSNFVSYSYQSHPQALNCQNGAARFCGPCLHSHGPHPLGRVLTSTRLDWTPRGACSQSAPTIQIPYHNPKTHSQPPRSHQQPPRRGTPWAKRRALRSSFIHRTW